MILGLSTCFRVGLIGECIGSIKDSLRQCWHLPCWYFCNCIFSVWACPHKSFFFFFFFFLWEYFWAIHAWQWTLGLFLLSYVYFAYSSNDMLACSCVWRLVLLDNVWALEEFEYVELLLSWDKAMKALQTGTFGPCYIHSIMR